VESERRLGVGDNGVSIGIRHAVDPLRAIPHLQLWPRGIKSGGSVKPELPESVSGGIGSGSIDPVRVVAVWGCWTYSTRANLHETGSGAVGKEESRLVGGGIYSRLARK
jgi:hypothetical protein